jgi:hypothetical protein
MSGFHLPPDLSIISAFSKKSVSCPRVDPAEAHRPGLIHPPSPNFSKFDRYKKTDPSNPVEFHKIRYNSAEF